MCTKQPRICTDIHLQCRQCPYCAHGMQRDSFEHILPSNHTSFAASGRQLWCLNLGTVVLWLSYSPCLQNMAQTSLFDCCSLICRGLEAGRGFASPGHKAHVLSTLRTITTACWASERSLWTTLQRHALGVMCCLSLLLSSAGALKLVGECFPWSQGSQFVHMQDNHNSVLGIREIALDQGASATCVEMQPSSGMSLSRGCHVNCAWQDVLCSQCHVIHLPTPGR